jgi:hypothetical protein
LRYYCGDVESKEIKNCCCKIPLPLAPEREKRFTHEKDINQHNPHAMHNGKMKTIKKWEEGSQKKMIPTLILKPWIGTRISFSPKQFGLVLFRNSTSA